MMTQFANSNTRASSARHHGRQALHARDRKSTRLNSSHSQISYAVFCLKKKKRQSSRLRSLMISAIRTNMVFLIASNSTPMKRAVHLFSVVVVRYTRLFDHSTMYHIHH